MVSSVDVLTRWRSVTFGAVAQDFISGGTPSTREAQFWKGSIPWTTSAPITEDATILDQAQRFISDEAIENSASHIVPKGNLLVSTRVGVGKAVVNLIDIAISQDLTGVVLDESVADALFLAYQFKTRESQDFLASRKRGTTIKGISRFDLQALPIRVPLLAEQHAIVHALRTVQLAIQTRRRELALERERKAALMQHLFTRGTGATSSSISTRFGCIPAHWKILPLSACADVQTGVAKGRHLGNVQTVSVPYLRVANVQDGRLDLTEIKEIEPRASEVERYRLQDGDVLMTEGGDLDKLGRGFIWRGQIANCVHQNHIFAVRAQQAVLLPEYLACLIQSSYGKAYFLSVAHKTTNLASINTTKLKSLPVPIPALSEQRRIADAIMAADNLIAALAREVGVLEELFRAVLEDLMTGKLSAVPLIESQEAVPV